MESSRQRLSQKMEDDRAVDMQDGSAALVYDVASMPGFRFQPTEEELVGFYLRSMVTGSRLEVELISVLDLYRYDPWELPAMAFMQGEREWLFFCPRDKKYPNGARPNRVTASGYWKATGTDRQVRRARDSRCIGVKKTLVFYTGKAPRGQKTEWIMNEYRLLQNEQISRQSCPRKDPREVALCRIYKKPVLQSPAPCHHGDSTAEDLGVESSSHIPYAECSRRRDRGALESEQASASTSGTSPSSTPGSLPPCRRSIFDDIELLCDTQASCSRSVKLENGPTQSYRSDRAPGAVDVPMEALLNAQRMHAEARRGRTIFGSPPRLRATTSASEHLAASVSASADRFSWLRHDVEHHCALALPGDDVADLLDHPGSSNLTSSSTIDRLKASMWSPVASTSLLAAKLDGEDLMPLSSSLFASHLGWTAPQPPWLSTISPARPPLLQFQGQSYLSSE